MLVLKFVTRVVQRSQIAYKICSVTNIYTSIARSELVTNKIHLRCDIPIVHVQHTVRRYVGCCRTTFAIANPVAATCFGCIKKPLSGRIYQKMSNLYISFCIF